MPIDFSRAPDRDWRYFSGFPVFLGALYYIIVRTHADTHNCSREKQLDHPYAYSVNTFSVGSPRPYVIVITIILYAHIYLRLWAIRSFRESIIQAIYYKMIPKLYII